MVYRAMRIAFLVSIGAFAAVQHVNATQPVCCQTEFEVNTVTPYLPQLCSFNTDAGCFFAEIAEPDATWIASNYVNDVNYCHCTSTPYMSNGYTICEGYCLAQPTATPEPQLTPTPTPPLPTPTVSPTPVFAKTLDHLECFAIKDSQNLNGFLYLAGPQFGLEPGCRVRKARKLCVPVAKVVDPARTKVDGVPWVQTFPFGVSVTCSGGSNEGAACDNASECPGGTCVSTPIPGQNLIDDYVCYKISCSLGKYRKRHVTDQFGERPIEVRKAYEVCAPARKVCHCETDMVGFATTCTPTLPDGCRAHPGSRCVCR